MTLQRNHPVGVMACRRRRKLSACVHWTVMTELEADMWRHRPRDAARIEASLESPDQLVELTADEL
jgi:hypothetical protein